MTVNFSAVEMKWYKGKQNAEGNPAEILYDIEMFIMVNIAWF